MPNNTTDSYWQDIESKYNNKINFKSYASLIHYKGKKANLHGLIYVINNIIHFEDFEPDNNIFGLPIKTNQKYIKTEFQFKISDYKICTTSGKMFQHCMNTSLKLEALKKTRPGFFDHPLCIIYNNSDYYIFDIANHKQLQKALQNSDNQ